MGNWKIRPSLFGPFVAMTKGRTVDFPYSRYLCREASERNSVLSAKGGNTTVLYFCLDAKVPKDQDLYKNGLGSRPPLLKFRNSLRSNNRNFFTQERSASTLRDSIFCKGRGLRKQGTGLVFFNLCFRSFWPFWK